MTTEPLPPAPTRPMPYGLPAQRSEPPATVEISPLPLPPEPPPSQPPPEQPKLAYWLDPEWTEPKRKRNWNLIVGICCVTAAIVGVLSYWAWDYNYTFTPTPGQSTHDQVIAWRDGGGFDRLKAIGEAETRIGEDGRVTTINCNILSRAVARAENYGPIPNKDAQFYWNNGLADMSAAVRACPVLVSTNDPYVDQQMAALIYGAGTLFQQAVNRVDAIANGQ
jgi:hypothetical protein